MTARAYFAIVRARIDRLGETQLPAIERAGHLVAEAIANGHRVWLTKTSHCLHDEATYRAGGFMAAHILDDVIAVAPGDVVIEGMNAGTSDFAVGIGLDAKERGATLIVLTQLPFEQHPEILLGHPSGKRVHEIADLTIDLGGEYGDGELTLDEPDVRVIPSSGATGVVALWMMFAEAAAILSAEGKPPLMWQAMQIPGAGDRNADLLRTYRRTSRGYATPQEAANA